MAKGEDNNRISEPLVDPHLPGATGGKHQIKQTTKHDKAEPIGKIPVPPATQGRTTRQRNQENGGEEYE